MADSYEPVLVYFQSNHGDTHYRGHPTSISGTKFQKDGSDYALNAVTVRASLKRKDHTAVNSTAYKAWVVSGHADGTISGAIPHTGIAWTGASQIRFYTTATAGATPRTMLGKAIDVYVDYLGPQWTP